eukprot:gnl/TRDRNA2_/TRDRNA2_176482_c0_seq7.p1 gnl/TRDRNA2_/TRDRNA2_176482_c0~~gnl/TRDRNA2_/TRDRNA2_176482_c0_seq7.p1  ORF type:complete len:335 (+),score=23.55 gnl/TRDRNA2_/TRDRNA2_176482_c0_seq7:36-1040(+)
MFHHTVLTFICQVLIFICCLLIACGLRMQEPPQHVSTYTSMQSSREPVALANFTVQASQGFTAQSQLASIPSERGPLMHLSWPIPLSSWMSVGSGEHISKDDGDDDDDDDGEPPSKLDWFMHILTVPWKLLFATIPPTDFAGGWACFCCSLFMVGVVTAFINDMASLLGCVLGLPSIITAITFVALGTSLPDTFASKTAAEQDPYADASIGNVTGSNSVNVFLGIGLPWCAGAIVWKIRGQRPDWVARYPALAKEWAGEGIFVVQAGDLAFSVCIYSCCALVTIILLSARRKFCGGELGGPPQLKYGTAAILVSLWVLYVGISSIKALVSCDLL